ncbi:hypothetical protein B0H14DRAFT_2838576, partial [Mycena olivaceomarginata]
MIGSHTRPSCTRFRLARPPTGALLAHLVSVAAVQEVYIEPAHPAVGLARAAPADGAREAHRRHPATTTLRASVIMPCNLDRGSGGDSLSAPYLPLVAQYERGLAVPSSYSFLHLRLSSPGPSSSSPASLPASESPCASASSAASEASHAHPPSPITSTFSDSTGTSEERP